VASSLHRVLLPVGAIGLSYQLDQSQGVRSSGHRQPSPSPRVDGVGSVRLARSAWRRSARPTRSSTNRWARSGRRAIIATRRSGGQPALGIELHHGLVAQRQDLLGPAQPQPLLCLGVTPEGSPPGLRATNTPSSGGAASGRRAGWQRRCAPADRFRVSGGHAQPVALEGLAQRRPGVPAPERRR
jgi:hypothetical protein